MPPAPPPDGVPNAAEVYKSGLGRGADFLKHLVHADNPFDFRPIDEPTDVIAPQKRPPRRLSWLKTVGPLPDDPALHRNLLAYASDAWLMSTSLLPHGVTWMTPGMQVASLDHAMWFHAPFRADEWLLHVTHSPRASGSRGLAHGSLYKRDGTLIASTMQQGLIRRRT
jgi:acyl-CoA thioesterase-2